MANSRKVLVFVTLLAALLIGLTACEDTRTNGGNSSAPSATAVDLHIVSGSENEALESIIQQWASDQNVTVRVTYQGSLDIMLDLEDGETEFDAVWPANSIWQSLGDSQHIVKHSQSILRSPVVLGVKKSIAEGLGWTDQDVYVEDILNAAEVGQIHLMMTSATQSNSGASAYFAFLYAFAGQPDVLTMDDLNSPEVAEKIRRILGAVDRSSGSSGWLQDLCVEQYNRCDAMMNYEALIIEANRELVANGQEPLYAVYPVDGLAIADSPLGYVDKGDADKEALFLELQAFLLSDETQQQILAHGRRAGLVGLSMDNVDTAIFNPAWGIDVSRVIQPIKFPSVPVIREALNLYQTAFRKPSFTVYCLDFSGSMDGQGEEELKKAMSTLLDQTNAQQYLLQASPNDITVVLIFSSDVHNRNAIELWTVAGNGESQLLTLNQRIENEQPGGGTNIYEPVKVALDIFDQIGIGNRFPAVILMTDGQSNEGSFSDLANKYRDEGAEIPVFAITFGDASTAQLNEIANLTTGRVFDGTTDLVAAFRKAKGYN
jgi:Ca-activated chloride channel family protein